MSLIRYCKTKTVMNDAKSVPTINVSYLDNPGAQSAVGNPYGVHSSPKKNTPCLIFQINNDPSNKIVVPLSMVLRNKNLKEGEVEVGAFDIGNYIKFNEDGDVLINTKGKVNISNGSEEIIDLIKQICAAIEVITTATAIGAQPIINKTTLTTLKSKIGAFIE